MFAADARRLPEEPRLGLSHGVTVMLVLLATVCLNVYLYVIIPKGFFPQQDTGRLVGGIQADQSISFQAMRQKLADFMAIVGGDPAVENVVGFTGGAQRNSGFMFVALKPLAERKETADQVIARLRGKLAKEPGANLFLQPVQDIRIGGPAEQRAVPVHAAGRRPRGPPRVGAEDPAGASQLARVGRRQHRPAGQGPADLARDRPRHRHAPRRDAADDRHDAERPLRPAPGVDDLRAAQPVPRGDGGGAAVLAVARDAEDRLRQHGGRRPGAAVGVRDLRSDQHAAGRQPPGAVRRLDDLVQPRARRVAVAGHARGRGRDGADRRADDGARKLPGQRARFPGLARQPAAADPRRR